MARLLQQTSPPSRRHLAWLLAAALVLAGVAQAAHWHKSELTGGSADVHCLLCVYGGGSAAPPTLIQPPALPLRRLWGAGSAPALPTPLLHLGSPYEARGPPVL